MANSRVHRTAKGWNLRPLEEFANLGANADWRVFHNRWPNFLPDNPEGFETVRLCLEKAAEEGDPVIELFMDKALVCLRDRVRAVWARSDPEGRSLAILLGFASEGDDGVTSRRSVAGGSHRSLRPSSEIPSWEKAVGTLPEGQPVLNGVTGEIAWMFSCQLQQCVYNLMQERWRAKVCTSCGQFFLASKPAQAACSSVCSHELTKKAKLEYWNTIGIKSRARKMAKAHSA